MSAYSSGVTTYGSRAGSVLPASMRRSRREPAPPGCGRGTPADGAGRPTRSRSRCAGSRGSPRRGRRRAARISSSPGRRRELAPELEQRGRALRLAACRLVQPRVLDRDGRVSGEHLEQADVGLVELVEPELRDDDHADHPGAVAERHCEQRLLDHRRARDPGAELAVRGVGDEERLAALRAAPRDALADPRAQQLERQRRASRWRGRRGTRSARDRRSRRRRRRDSCGSR